LAVQRACRLFSRLTASQKLENLSCLEVFNFDRSATITGLCSSPLLFYLLSAFAKIGRKKERKSDLMFGCHLLSYQKRCLSCQNIRKASKGSRIKPVTNIKFIYSQKAALFVLCTIDASGFFR